MEQTSQIKDKLKMYHGSISRVIERSGKSRSWVGKVLEGKVKSIHVIRAATEIITELEQEKILEEEEFNSLINSITITKEALKNETANVPFLG